MRKSRTTEMKTIKTVLIGAGYRGMRLLRLMKQIHAFRITALFDPSSELLPEEKIERFSGETNGYKEMILRHRPDLVVIASPWKWHVEQAMYALEQGCHVALEIKGGLKTDEYCPLISLAEQKGLRIYPLENTVFMRENMAMLNLVQAGVLGNLVALRGGYRHDLRDMLIDEQGFREILTSLRGYGEAGFIWKRTVTFILHTDWHLSVWLPEWDGQTALPNSPRLPHELAA